MPKLPDRHPQLDFLVANFLDAVPKDDLASMEHPLFALKPDLRVREYEHRGNTLTVMPSGKGAATIWDKDVLLYCLSQLMAAANRGAPISRTVRVTAYDLLVATNRPTGGQNYAELREALDRLRGTTLKTNIVSGGHRVRRAFGLIDEYTIIERRPGDTRMAALEIVLSRWLFAAVEAREVLTISREYFRLRKGLERRLYELARRHCGNQAFWVVGVDALRTKSGSRSTPREFRRMLEKLVEAQGLPDYRLELLDGGQVRFESLVRCG